MTEFPLGRLAAALRRLEFAGRPHFFLRTIAGKSYADAAAWDGLASSSTRLGPSDLEEGSIAVPLEPLKKWVSRQTFDEDDPFDLEVIDNALVFSFRRSKLTLRTRTEADSGPVRREPGESFCWKDEYADAFQQALLFSLADTTKVTSHIKFQPGHIVGFNGVRAVVIRAADDLPLAAVPGEALSVFKLLRGDVQASFHENRIQFIDDIGLVRLTCHSRPETYPNVVKALEPFMDATGLQVTIPVKEMLATLAWSELEEEGKRIAIEFTGTEAILRTRSKESEVMVEESVEVYCTPFELWVREEDLTPALKVMDADEAVLTVCHSNTRAHGGVVIVKSGDGSLIGSFPQLGMRPS